MRSFIAIVQRVGLLMRLGCVQDLHSFNLVSGNLLFIFKFFGRTARHVGSQFPDRGSNPHPLRWKSES